MDHTAIEYLESKRTVDSRARSQRVRDQLVALLSDRPSVIDAGAGTGVMVRNLLDWGVRPERYLGIDHEPQLTAHALRNLPQELAPAFQVAEIDDGFVVDETTVRFDTRNVLELSNGSTDLVIGQAVLDLVPIPAAMDAITRALRPGGFAYLPITFDGVSLFMPGHPADERVIAAYHSAIDETPGRSSRAGRILLEHLSARAGTLVAVDASDWIVRPQGNGYPASEAVFLSWILDFIEDSLKDQSVDASAWLDVRRTQLDRGELSYVAHGYDFLYQTPG